MPGIKDGHSLPAVVVATVVVISKIVEWDKDGIEKLKILGYEYRRL